MRHVPIIVFILFANFISGQTNVDTNFLNYKWSGRDAVVDTFRNGKPITYAKNKQEWIDAIASDKPAYCHYNFDPNEVVLYNFHAVTHPSGLAPFGSRIPTRRDFREIFKDTRKTREYQIFTTQHLKGYYESMGCEGLSGSKCEEYGRCEFEDKERKSSYWTSESVEDKEYGTDLSGWVFCVADETYYSVDTKVLLNEGDPNKFFSTEDIQSGCSVRFIKKKSEYKPAFSRSYKVLMPSEYEALREELRRSIAEKFTFTNESEKIPYSFKLKFDDFGNNRSSSLIRSNLQDAVLSDLEKWPHSPLYQGTNLPTEEIIKGHFVYDKKEDIQGATLSDYDIEDFQDIPLSIMGILKSDEKKITYKVRHSKLKFYDESNSVDEELHPYHITKAKGKGPGYAALSIVPGWGAWNVAEKKNKWYVMLICSAVTGATCIMSKLYSNQEYARYQADATHNQKHFDQANTFQKVFLVSGGIYGAMLLVDLTITIKKGSENKRDAKKINKYIKGGKGIRLKWDWN